MQWIRSVRQPPNCSADGISKQDRAADSGGKRYGNAVSDADMDQSGGVEKFGQFREAGDFDLIGRQIGERGSRLDAELALEIFRCRDPYRPALESYCRDFSLLADRAAGEPRRPLLAERERGV